LNGAALALALDNDDDPHIEIRFEADGASYPQRAQRSLEGIAHDLLCDNQA